MPPAFGHEIALTLDDGADERAPGGAVTVELCGSWEHTGACRWPHLTTVASRAGRQITVRVLFVATTGEETEVRRRIVRAVRAGALVGPGGTSRWTVRDERVVTPSDEELRLADTWPVARPEPPDP